MRELDAVRSSCSSDVVDCDKDEASDSMSSVSEHTLCRLLASGLRPLRLWLFACMCVCVCVCVCEVLRMIQYDRKKGEK